jgi:hypothetical protein
MWRNVKGRLVAETVCKQTKGYTRGIPEKACLIGEIYTSLFLGHNSIKTTLRYTHVMQPQKLRSYKAR